MSSPASDKHTSVITESPIMEFAVIPSQFSMKPTMPRIVAVTISIVEAIVLTFQPIVQSIVPAFAPVMRMAVVVTTPSAMLRVDGECANGQQ